MPKTIAREDHRVLVTIGYLENYPNMGVLDTIDGEDNEDGKDNKRQRQWIHNNQLKEAAEGMAVTTATVMVTATMTTGKDDDNNG
jgi:hypothetical protein